MIGMRYWEDHVKFVKGAKALAEKEVERIRSLGHFPRLLQDAEDDGWLIQMVVDFCAVRVKRESR